MKKYSKRWIILSSTILLSSKEILENFGITSIMYHIVKIYHIPIYKKSWHTLSFFKKNTINSMNAPPLGPNVYRECAFIERYAFLKNFTSYSLKNK